jgi:hypothetical protein
MRMCNSIDSLEGRRENDGHILKKKKLFQVDELIVGILARRKSNFWVMSVAVDVKVDIDKS